MAHPTNIVPCNFTGCGVAQSPVALHSCGVAQSPVALKVSHVKFAFDAWDEEPGGENASWGRARGSSAPPACISAAGPTRRPRIDCRAARGTTPLVSSLDLSEPCYKHGFCFMSLQLLTGREVLRTHIFWRIMMKRFLWGVFEEMWRNAERIADALELQTAVAVDDIELPYVGTQAADTRATSFYEDYLHRGVAEPLASMNLYVSAMHVSAVEAGKFDHGEFDFSEHYVKAKTHVQVLHAAPRIPYLHGISMPKKQKDPDMWAAVHIALLRKHCCEDGKVCGQASAVRHIHIFPGKSRVRVVSPGKDSRIVKDTTGVLAEWKATEARVRCLADRVDSMCLVWTCSFLRCLYVFFVRPVSQQTKLLKSLLFHIVQLVLFCAEFKPIDLWNHLFLLCVSLWVSCLFVNCWSGAFAETIWAHDAWKKRFVFLLQRFSLVVQEREYIRVRGFHLSFAIAFVSYLIQFSWHPLLDFYGVSICFFELFNEISKEILCNFYCVSMIFYGVSKGVSMVVLWESYGGSRGCLWDFLCIPMGFLRYFYDISMGFLWDVHDGSFGFLWYFYEITMGFKHDFYDISRGIIWEFYGISMKFLWNFYGGSMVFLWDFYWISIGFLCDFYGISMVVLWNFSGIS